MGLPDGCGTWRDAGNVISVVYYMLWGSNEKGRAVFATNDDDLVAGLVGLLESNLQSFTL